MDPTQSWFHVNAFFYGRIPGEIYTNYFRLLACNVQNDEYYTFYILYRRPGSILIARTGYYPWRFG